MDDHQEENFGKERIYERIEPEFVARFEIINGSFLGLSTPPSIRFASERQI